MFGKWDNLLPAKTTRDKLYHLVNTPLAYTSSYMYSYSFAL